MRTCRSSPTSLGLDRTQVPGAENKDRDGRDKCVKPMIDNHDLLRRRPGFSEDKPLITPCCPALLLLACEWRAVCLPHSFDKFW